MSSLRMSLLLVSAGVTALVGGATGRMTEVWTRAQEDAAGVRRHSIAAPLPADTVRTEDLPDQFSWANNDGVSYVTKNLNQHIPQYCGSCWAHGAISALGDRIKIARKAKGVDINLAVQHVLNCGTAGSCHGGSGLGVYSWIADISNATGVGVTYDTCNPYMACSAESTEGFCGLVNATTWDCRAANICRTCSTFTANGGTCVEIDHYPNATVKEFGPVSGADDMAKEIFARGPIACDVDAGPLENYTGGVITDVGKAVDHIVSLVGWGTDPHEGDYWIMRNSWGEFWGEMGYARVGKGKNALLLESNCAWAVPDRWTEMETGGNYACHEDGGNCNLHLPPPPPTNCRYCSKHGIMTCSELGMHCNCGDALYNTTGKGMPHGESCSSSKGCTGKCANLV
eukprot:m.417680 g.417680  ORF g.417680 m.417680 type:complete len:399 (+) comp30573_c0_seq1:30-1226(+)